MDPISHLDHPLFYLGRSRHGLLSPIAIWTTVGFGNCWICNLDLEFDHSVSVFATKKDLNFFLNQSQSSCFAVKFTVARYLERFARFACIIEMANLCFLVYDRVAASSPPHCFGLDYFI